MELEHVNHVHQDIIQVKERESVRFVKPERSQRKKVDRHNVFPVLKEHMHQVMGCRHALNVQKAIMLMKKGQ